MILNADDSALLAQARLARENAHAPYSGFCVGAALRTFDGRVFRGCNVETASYGLAMCAERTAFFAAIAAGCKAGDVEVIVVVADTPGPISPCGACRQVMIELGGAELRVVMCNLRSDFATATAASLLPAAFSFDPPGAGSS